MGGEPAGVGFRFGVGPARARALRDRLTKSFAGDSAGACRHGRIAVFEVTGTIEETHQYGLSRKLIERFFGLDEFLGRNTAAFDVRRGRS